MSDYMDSLQKLRQKIRSEDQYFPRPRQRHSRCDTLRAELHRPASSGPRGESILHRLSKGAADIPTMVRAIYIGLDPRLVGAAGLSVLAHLEDMVARGVVSTEGDPVIGGNYRMAEWLGRHSGMS